MSKTNDPKYPLFSIVTPSFNQGCFIRETIESVLKQSYPAFEYIIVDGRSTDNTISILEEYADDCKYISEEDNGQAHAVNKGIKMAKGDIIGWVNSDDIYMPNTLNKVAEFFIENPECNILYGNAYIIDEKGKITGRYPTESFSYKRLADRCYICQPSVFFRKSIVEDIGFLDESLHLCLDYDLWIRLGMKHKFIYIEDILACSRMYTENKTMSRYKEVYEEAQKILYKHYGYIPLSWIKSKIFYDNPGYANSKVFVESIKTLVRDNYRYPTRILRELFNALIRQTQGYIKWR